MSPLLGLENAILSPPDVLRRARFGLLMNQASVDRQMQYAHRLSAAAFPGRLRALFSPQHGLWSEKQDNMIESPHAQDRQLGVPVYSLYSQTRIPSPEMLAGLDLLVVDLQDVGCRVYTFVWTVSYCLQACAEADVDVLVLDRPNPLGGAVEGPYLEPGYESFVGRAPIPMRHGLTLGELTLAVNEMLGIGANVEVVPMTGWRRDMRFAEFGRAWIPPSPNLPRLESVDVYPGQVLLEGTTISEGRGTTTPFEVCGAPFVEAVRLIEELSRYDLSGVVFRPIRFEPTFQKHAGAQCEGVYLHVTSHGAFRPYRTSLAVLAAMHRLWPADFCWRRPPYEYETVKPPIDILAGTSTVRAAIDSDQLTTADDLGELADGDPTAWYDRVDRHLIYR